METLIRLELRDAEPLVADVPHRCDTFVEEPVLGRGEHARTVEVIKQMGADEMQETVSAARRVGDEQRAVDQTVQGLHRVEPAVTSRADARCADDLRFDAQCDGFERAQRHTAGKRCEGGEYDLIDHAQPSE